MPDRARLKRQAREHDLGTEHPGAVGLDLRQRRLQDDPVCQQRTQRRRSQGHPHDRQLERCGIVLESGEGQPPKVISETVIANGIPWRDSPEALVVGPTGLRLSPNGTLYLANTVANSITAIPQALTRITPAAKGGTTLTKGGHLNEPLGLTIAPSGNIITTNAGDGNIVETTPGGQQVAVQTAEHRRGLDPPRRRQADGRARKRDGRSPTAAVAPDGTQGAQRSTAGRISARGSL
jgi:hypothetical protein